MTASGNECNHLWNSTTLIEDKYVKLRLKKQIDNALLSELCSALFDNLILAHPKKTLL